MRRQAQAFDQAVKTALGGIFKKMLAASQYQADAIEVDVQPTQFRGYQFPGYTAKVVLRAVNDGVRHLKQSKFKNFLASLTGMAQPADAKHVLLAELDKRVPGLNLPSRSPDPKMKAKNVIFTYYVADGKATQVARSIASVERFVGWSRIAGQVAGMNYLDDTMLPARQLGEGGPMIPMLGLGAQSSIEEGTEEQGFAVFRAALDAGVRYIDTAHAYGDSQRRLGMWMRAVKPLPDLFLATKVDKRDRDDFFRQLDENIELLGRTPDLLQVHAVQEEEEQVILAHNGPLAAANEAREKGLCHYVGITGHDDPQTMANIIRFGDGIDTALVAVSAADTRFVREFIPVARSRGVGIIGMKVMGRGRLIRPGGPGVQCAGQAIRFTLSNPVDVAIVGFSYPEEVYEVAAVAQGFVPMTRAEMNDIEHGTAMYADDVMFYRNELQDWKKTTGMRPSLDYFVEGASYGRISSRRRPKMGAVGD